MGEAPDRFELVVSELVRQEAAIGDRDAARARISILASLVTLDATPKSDGLAETIVRTGAVSHAAMRDAAHIAIAAANGVEYLVTWNFRHIRKRGGKTAHRVCVSARRLRASHDQYS